VHDSVQQRENAAEVHQCLLPGNIYPGVPYCAEWERP